MRVGGVNRLTSIDDFTAAVLRDLDDDLNTGRTTLSMRHVDALTQRGVVLPTKRESDALFAQFNGREQFVEPVA